MAFIAPLADFPRPPSSLPLRASGLCRLGKLDNSAADRGILPISPRWEKLLFETLADVIGGGGGSLRRLFTGTAGRYACARRSRDPVIRLPRELQPVDDGGLLVPRYCRRLHSQPEWKLGSGRQHVPSRCSPSGGSTPVLTAPGRSTARSVTRQMLSCYGRAVSAPASDRVWRRLGDKELLICRPVHTAPVFCQPRVRRGRSYLGPTGSF